MRVALFDDVGAGHRPVFMGGICRELTAAGHRITGVGSADDDGGHRPPDAASWHTVERTTDKDVLRGRAMLAGAVATCAAEGVEVWLDLDLNRNILRVDRRLLAIPRRAHVIHRFDRPFHRYGSLPGRLRTLYSLRRLRWLARHGSRFAVHTRRAVDYLSDFVPRETLVHLHMPVDLPDAAPATPGARLPGDGPMRLLFVGRVRHDRGFATLLAAMERLPEGYRLLMVGRQDPGLEERVREEHPALDVEWHNRYVSQAELVEAYRTTSLAVLPYDASNGEAGAHSMVFTEAMGHGAPLVLSPTVGKLLPADHRGSVVAESHAPGALTAAIERAAARLPALAEAAAEDGPRIVRERHSYRAYALGFLEAALASG